MTDARLDISTRRSIEFFFSFNLHNALGRLCISLSLDTHIFCVSSNASKVNPEEERKLRKAFHFLRLSSLSPLLTLSEWLFFYIIYIVLLFISPLSLEECFQMSKESLNIYFRRLVLLLPVSDAAESWENNERESNIYPRLPAVVFFLFFFFPT